MSNSAKGVRPSVAALAAYRPGKSAEQANTEHGIDDAIKLASNENPYPPLPAVTQAAAAATLNANRYADHRASALRQRLGTWLGVSDERITVGCGSVGLLQQLCLTFVDPGDEVVFPWLSFEAYPVYTKMMSGVAVNPPLVDHAFDMAAVADAVTDKTKLILLATPNNPTGTAISNDDVSALLGRVPSDVIVVVDEAYREFSDDALGDPVDLVADHDNVIVTRTFSKAFGLAGLRIGYAVAHPDVITEMDKVLLAFAVNGAAQAAAMAVIENRADYQPFIDSLLAERTRLVTALRAQGHQLPDTQANFVYLPLGAQTAEVNLGLERLGVVTRPFPGHGIRVTVGTEAENNRFLDALTEAIAAL